MSACVDISKLQALLDDALADGEFQQIAEHVDECRACQSRLDQLTQIALTTDEVQREFVEHQSEAGLRELFAQLRNPQGVTIEQPTGLADSDVPLPERIGDFEIVAALGTGASGLLLKANDIRLHRPVAIKLLRPELLNHERSRLRFEREARAVAAIQHEHIVTLHDVSIPPNGPAYLVMEFIDRGSLADRLDTGELLEHRQVTQWVSEVAEALHAAHEANIIHRDVKPSNLLIDGSSQRIKLGDFGLARQPEEEARLTQDGIITGTPAYMSPEQVREPQAIDHRTDIYSLGVVLYELLTGRVPYRGVVQMVLTQVVNEQPVPPRQLQRTVPVELEAICLKAMSKQPADRYQTSLQLAEDLHRWLAGTPVHALSGRKPWHNLMRGSRRRATAAAAGLFVCVALASILLWAQWGRPNDAGASLTNTASPDVQPSDFNDGRRIALADLKAIVAEHDDEYRYPVTLLNREQEQQAVDSLAKLRKATSTVTAEGTPDLTVARAHQQMGRILLTLERLAEARDEFSQAMQCLASNDASAALTEDELECSVETQIWQVETNNLLMRFAKTTDSLQAAESAHAELARRFPENRQLDSLQARLLIERAFLHYQKDAISRAISDYRAGIELLERELRQTPSDGAIENRLMESRIGLGFSLIDEAELDQGLEQLRQAIAIGENSQQPFPAEVHVRLPYVYLQASEICLQRQNLSLAIELAEAGRSISQRLTDSLPDRGEQNLEYVQANGLLGALYHAQGGLAEAAFALNESLALGRNWMARADADEGFAAAVAMSLLRRGRVAAQSGSTEEAQATLQEALALKPSNRKLDESLDPDAAFRSRLVQAACRVELALLSLNRDTPGPDARPAAAQTLRFVNQRIDEFAEYPLLSVVDDYEVIRLLAATGDLAVKLDDLDTAWECYRTGVDFLELLEGRWEEIPPQAMGYPLALRMADGLAEVEAQQGRKKSADRWRTRAAKLRAAAASSSD